MKETESAQIPSNILPDCLGVKAVRSKGVWETYRKFMQQRWLLTDAQSRIAVEIIKGHKVEVIALHLGISVETVKMELDAVSIKLAEIISQEAGGAQTSTEAVSGKTPESI